MKTAIVRTQGNKKKEEKNTFYLHVKNDCNDDTA